MFFPRKEGAEILVGTFAYDDHPSFAFRREPESRGRSGLAFSD
jgi:hypothetical protein